MQDIFVGDIVHYNGENYLVRFRYGSYLLWKLENISTLKFYWFHTIFDKVRENTKGIAASGRTTYSKAANLAVNQTIVRSFNTSLVALLPVGSILFVGAGLLGAGTLKDLSLALFIGLITGTYSSICIATPILAGLREREPAMQALAKRVGTRGDKASTNTSTVVESKSDRGPRNQPKRDRRR